MSRLPPMNAITYFEAVARHSRITKAAEELLVTPSAISQQIKILEESLGVSLFRRVKRRLILTEEGERLYTSASQALDLIKQAERTIGRSSGYRKLTIRVSPTFGTRWLMPRLHKFVHAHPTIDLHVDATTDLTDFERENVDLEIRYGRENRVGLTSELLAKDTVLPMCSPKYLSEHDASNIHKCLSNVRFIHSVKALVSWEEWLSKNHIEDIDTNAGLRFDRSVMALQLAQDSAGVTLESTNNAFHELESQLLVPMFPKMEPIEFEAYWLICPSRHLKRRAVQEFRGWLLAEIADHEKKLKNLHKKILTHPPERKDD
ncbi:LysR substrate-binding domain-containing protein [Terasakiella sp. SH-1]|uniref:LysR substrate-binding domain-containing protein n=1 Tax=Terasakiella sp. SH-1 TaxID=2560057 RepID=UPI001073BA35|nr:LysR substrate-binding domain-containing protein [Terasakiella sp. SH-1]